ncbi:hypothetical protein JDV02_003097 [Purpureocillium takamizusanense]|uniref:DNA/RNA-binding domain-containing protein n=1 Tax=Purpureocillium takamizusanense TaxID=2060973 RepID=A0A9Q8V8G8_9HYPO|nr:uncharacterized protein JDV02_003097 [Purpureocillium takamizusanense]UNI16683.1 hypothetical protein JDV02_003097 [Purpureocillium takamizusanense]
MERLTWWFAYFRNTGRQEAAAQSSCPLCKAEIQPNLGSFEAHVCANVSSHSSLAINADIEDAFGSVTIHSPQSHPAAWSPGATGRGRPTRRRSVSGGPATIDRANELERHQDPEDQTEGYQRRSKKLTSTPAAVAQLHGSSPPAPCRSPVGPSDWSEFNCSFTSSSDDDAGLKTPRPGHSQLISGNGRQSPQNTAQRDPQWIHGSPVEHSSVPEMIREPQTKPISPEQLVAEVDGIYAGLVELESKCRGCISTQDTKQLSQEQYQALIALHRSVLHDHYDFFQASQHPSASEALRYLASKKAMTVRMWRHGMHSFLELLRHRLPDSVDHMVTFIHTAYSITTLLYETVPAFEEIWMECLGDLSRIRMDIEDDTQDKETWTDIAKDWYTKASDKSPTIGRLYHHRAILARPNALQQLYLYAKSLCVLISFPGTRDSIFTLLDPFLNGSPHELDPADAAFMRVHGIFFSGESREKLEGSMNEFLSLLDDRIEHEDSFFWLEKGYYLSISLCCLMLDFGAESNVLMQALTRRQISDRANGKSIQETDWDPEEKFEQSLQFVVRIYEIVLRRLGDINMLSFIHTMLVFMLRMSQLPAAMSHLESRYPWGLTCAMLNSLLGMTVTKPRIDTEEFPGPQKQGEEPVPLPEDHALRGLLFAEHFFPNGWFGNSRLDETKRYMESASRTLNREKRLERILWIGRNIANAGKWLTWDAKTRRFGEASPLPSSRKAMGFGSLS